MKILDINVLLYAINEDDPHHLGTRTWLNESFNSYESIGFAWNVLLGFVRISTLPGMFPRPLSVSEATTHIREWVQCPMGIIVEPTSAHMDIISGLLAETGTGGNLVSDAHLAALAIEHEATLVSYDRDFARFNGVHCEVPSIS